MKSKYIFIVILLYILSALFSSNVYAKHIVKMNELTDNELIEYGRQLEKEEQEREQARQQLQENANKEFNELVQKKNIETFLKYAIPIVFSILIIIIIVLVVKLHNKRTSDKLLDKNYITNISSLFI